MLLQSRRKVGNEAFCKAFKKMRSHLSFIKHQLCWIFLSRSAIHTAMANSPQLFEPANCFCIETTLTV